MVVVVAAAGAMAVVPTWQLAQAVDDLQSPLLQRQPVLAHHQGEHDERHKLAGVGLRGKQRVYTFHSRTLLHYLSHMHVSHTHINRVASIKC